MVQGGVFSSVPEKTDVNYILGGLEKAEDHVPEPALLAPCLSVWDLPRLILSSKLCKKEDFLFLHSFTTSCENLFRYSIIQMKCLLMEAA